MGQLHSRRYLNTSTATASNISDGRVTLLPCCVQGMEGRKDMGKSMYCTAAVQSFTVLYGGSMTTRCQKFQKQPTKTRCEES